MVRDPRILGLVLTLAISFPSYAQYSGYLEVKDMPAFRKKFAAGSAALQSMECNFVQEKVLMALTEKITSTGKFWFKRSNKVRIEYVRPFQYLLVMQGDKIFIRDHGQEQRIQVKSNRLFQQVNRIMIDCVQGTILESKDFTTRVFEDDGTYLLEMTPTGKTLQEFFQTVVLVVDKKDYAAHSIAMNEPTGDTTVITFKDKNLNTPIADGVFAL
jgi:outer membrane lipoprotein-sorting protein